MSFRIRTKLIIAFFAMLVPFSLVFIANYFFTKEVHESIHTSKDISYEMENLGDLQLAIDRLLMPANDYIITADPRERVEFNRLAGEVEKHLALIPMEKRCQRCHPARTSEMVARFYGREASKDLSEEMLILKEIRDKFEGIKKYGEAIFSIEKPLGSADAARLMKEMDTLGHKTIDGPIGRHRQMEKEDMQKANDASDAAWRWFMLSRTLGYLTALIIGVVITLIYSGRLATVINVLHKSSDGIARGDFKTRLDIKTGDELEQLSNAMNEMAAQLDLFTSNLEGKVEERTEALQRSEQKYRTLIENLQEGIWMIDKDANTSYVNSKMAEMLGYTVDEMMGKPLFAFMDERGKEISERNIERRKAGIKEQHDFEFIRKDGTRIYTALETAPILDDAGNYIGALAGVIDITQRREAEEKLQESEEKYRGIFEKMPNAMVAFDAGTWRFETVNRAAIDLYGYTEEEFLSLTPVDVSAEVEKSRKALQDGLAEKSAHIPIRYHKKKDGTVFPVEIFMGTFLSRGRPKGFAVILDLTERKEAEEKLNKNYEDIKSMNKMMVDREIRMMELKKEIERLKDELGKKSS